MAQTEAKFADPDQVWKIWVKDGKETPLHFTTFTKLEMHKEKYPEIYEAVFKEGGLKDTIEKYVYSQGQEGQAQPTVEVGDNIIGIRYYEDTDSYSVSRKPKRSYQGGGKAAPLLTLTEVVVAEDVRVMNDRLTAAKEGEIYRAGNPLFTPDGKLVVLKLKAVG